MEAEQNSSYSTQTPKHGHWFLRWFRVPKVPRTGPDLSCWIVRERTGQSRWGALGMGWGVPVAIYHWHKS